MKRFKPCLLCIAVATLWLALSLGVVLGRLDPVTTRPLIAILMGASVMGIANMGEKRLRSAAAHPTPWKLAVLIVGVPVAYFALAHLSLGVMLGELAVLLAVGSVLFRATSGVVEPKVEKKGGNGPEGFASLMNRLEHCCDD